MKINGKPISIITVSDDRGIGVKFRAEAEQLSVLQGTITAVVST